MCATHAPWSSKACPSLGWKDDMSHNLMQQQRELDAAMWKPEHHLLPYSLVSHVIVSSRAICQGILPQSCLAQPGVLCFILIYVFFAEHKGMTKLCVSYRRVGWDVPEAWHAHCCMLNDEEMKQFADNKVGIAHCPSSNMRLASGDPRQCNIPHSLHHICACSACCVISFVPPLSRHLKP